MFARVKKKWPKNRLNDVTTEIEIKLEQMKQALQRIPVDEIMVRITERNKDVIEDKNIAQMDAGLDGNGEPISPPYSPFTIVVKKIQGRPFDRVTLKDQGDFHKGTKANIMATGFEMINTDSKWGKLTDKYGDVIGLSEQSITELQHEVYLPEFAHELKNYFQTA